MRKTASLLLVVLAAGGCGRGSSPTESTPTANIQGTWVGSISTLAVTGTCIADNFRPNTAPSTWVIQQNGTAFTAKSTLNFSLTCPYTGTVRGNAITYTPDLTSSAVGCGNTDLPCYSSDGSVYRVHLVLQANRSTATGVVIGTQLKLMRTFVWKATDGLTGAALGDLQSTASEDLQKQ